MRPAGRALLAAAVLLPMGCGPAAIRGAEWGSLETNRRVSVSSGKAWYSVFEITSTAQVRVDFAVQAGLSIGVVLMTDAQAKKYMMTVPLEFICLEPAVQGRMSFVETIAPGRYTVEFDNRGGTLPVAVEYSVKIRGARMGTGGAPEPVRDEAPKKDRSIRAGSIVTEFVQVQTFDLLTRIQVISVLWMNNVNLEEEERGVTTIYKIAKEDEARVSAILGKEAADRKLRMQVGTEYFPGAADTDFLVRHVKETYEKVLTSAPFAESTELGRFIRHPFVRDEMAKWPRLVLVRFRPRPYLDFKESESTGRAVIKGGADIEIVLSREDGAEGYRMTFQYWDGAAQAAYLSGTGLDAKDLALLPTRYSEKS